jgi:hypothetical protein
MRFDSLPSTIHEMQRCLWVWAHDHSIGSYGKGTKQMRGTKPMCSRDNGLCPLILKPDPITDMEGRFTVLVTMVSGRWNGGIS